MAPRVTGPTLKVVSALLDNVGQEMWGGELGRATGLLAGTLYPILYRLEGYGWLRARQEGESGEHGGLPRVLYSLTGQGQRDARAWLDAALADLGVVGPHPTRSAR
jgi:hypothetical protein